MKRIYLFPILYAIINLAASCDDDQQKFFDGETSMHFALSTSQLDSMSFSFMNTSEEVIVVYLPVAREGYADKDQEFRLKTDPANTTATAGKHYLALAEKYLLKKGEYNMEVPVTLRYDQELDSLAVRLVLTLEPLGEMAAGIPYRQQVTIISSNLLPPIPDWNTRYQNFFGVYSKVKHRYILSELKLSTVVDFENSTEWRKISENQRTAYGWQMNNFFAEHEIYDENGQRIEPWMN